MEIPTLASIADKVSKNREKDKLIELSKLFDIKILIINNFNKRSSKAIKTERRNFFL